MKNSVTVKLLCLCIAAAVLVSGCMPIQTAIAPLIEPAAVLAYHYMSMQPEEIDDAPAPPIGIAVETSFARRDTITNELTYIGQVQPLKTVNIASMLVAEVTAVNFNIGDAVEEGDVLFTVDAQDIQNQIRQLNAAIQSLNIGVESAQYGLELALEGSAQQRLQEIQHEMGVHQAATGLDMAAENRRNANQQQRLLRDQIWDLDDEISAIEGQISTFIRDVPRDVYVFNPDHWYLYDPALAAQFAGLQSRSAALQSARTQLEAQMQSLRSAARQAEISQSQAGTNLYFAEESLDVYRELAEQSRQQAQTQAEFGVRSAQAQLESTQIQLSIARGNLGRAVITSPISGVISGRTVEVGQFVSQAVMPFTIIQIDPVIVQVSVSEALINLVYPGQEVSVAIQALGEEQTFTGTVSIVSPIANHASTFPVRIELENSEELIRPGMFAQVTFVEARSDNAFVLPRGAVLSDADGQFVFVAQDGEARRVAVETGLQSGDEVEITGGVSARDEIIVMGQEFLHDGAIVNIVAVDGQRVSG